MVFSIHAKGEALVECYLLFISFQLEVHDSKG
jgi:hypothetical protein